MNNLLWSQIAEDYEKAKNYLYCPKGVEEWHREEEKRSLSFIKSVFNGNKRLIKGNKIRLHFNVFIFKTLDKNKLR